MIKLHHLNNSRSQRIIWLLEEIGKPYEIVRYERDAKSMRAPASLKKVHPLGKSPVVEDGKIVLAETGAILEYLADAYAPQMAAKAGADDRWRLTYWLHYAEGSLMPQLLIKLIGQRMGLLGWPLRSNFDPQLAMHLEFVESELGKSAWIAGPDLTIADVMMSFPLEVAVQRAKLNKKKFAKTFDYVARIHARPAYQRALNAGGKYDFV